MRCCGSTSCSNEQRQRLAAPDGEPPAGTGTMPDGDLQVHPGQLDFTAAVGTDAPVTLTLFNPHPSERLAFKVSSLPTRVQSADTPSAPSQEGSTAEQQNAAFAVSWLCRLSDAPLHLH